MAIAIRSDFTMERKIISISSKRQVTIPQKYFEALSFSNEAECILQNGSIVIRPVKIEGGNFSEEILEDLIAQGYSGKELLEQFKLESKKIRPAVEALISESDKIAKNKKETISLDELFGLGEA